MTDYQTFLDRKHVALVDHGHEPGPIHDRLFPWQADIVRWSVRRGRAAIFADCGLGKTLMQVAWAAQVPGDVLIVAPLAVAQQTIEEARTIGVTVTWARSNDEVMPGISIVNYEMLHAFDASRFAGVVLDESSILKSYSGKIRNQIIAMFGATAYRLACTATPSPNDHMELGNHAEFLGVCTRTEMLATFFCHDGGSTSQWRLKGHAEAQFWQWLCEWAVAIRTPSDLGYEDAWFTLPPITYHTHLTGSSYRPDGYLVPVGAVSLTEQRRARREGIAPRVGHAASLVNGSSEPWLIWCDLNDEADALRKSIPDATEVRGSDDREDKTEKLMAFTHGTARVLVTKARIAGFGMNWQHCARVCFVGLSHSYEQFYQAIRRCWRFRQTRPVEVHIILSDAETEILRSIRVKQDAAEAMQTAMIAHMSDISTSMIHQKGRRRMEPLRHDEATGDGWRMIQGDCVDVARTIDAESIGFSVFSPPFASLYTYSDSERDMGNSRTYEEFSRHFQFLTTELYRVLMPGRLCAVHCMNLPTHKEREGYIGLRDFRGDLIRSFQAEGFIYHSEVVIWKDPVTAMQRTKALGLLHKQLKKDSTMSRQGIPDYVVIMRKPGVNEEPVTHTADDFPVDLWQRYASPVWFDINPSKTLQRDSVREEKDERHIAPLQLEVIERCLMLWSNPGDVVLSPFAGIGSEGYVSIQQGRRFLGIELKASYYRQAVANLVAETNTPSLFSSTPVNPIIADAPLPITRSTP